MKMLRVRGNNEGEGHSSASMPRSERMSFAEEILKRQKLVDERLTNAKITNLTENSRYIDLSHVGATSCVVERLFSQAGMVLTERRKSMTSQLFEAVMLLHLNRSMWSINTVIEALRKLKDREDGRDDVELIEDDDENAQQPDMFDPDSDDEKEAMKQTENFHDDYDDEDDY